MQSKTRKWLLSRVIAPIAAGLLAILAVLFSGSDYWFEQLRPLTQSYPDAAPLKAARRQGPVGTPVLITPARPQGNDSSVSPVALPLVLVRTQLGRNVREGFAQIGVNPRSPQTYVAGALLANGTRLSEIHEHYVVLERDGHSVRLYLLGDPGGSSAAALSPLLIVGGTQPPAPAIVTSQDTLNDYLRPTPVFAGNQLRGYELYPGRNRDSFGQLGLRPGDVLTSINGAAVSTASLATLHTLVEGTALTVEIVRQGETQTLSLDGSILTRAIALSDALKKATTPKTTL